MVPYRYKARVVRIVDGDTIDALVDLGFRVYISIRFRLSGIDTPEIYSTPKGSPENEAGQAARIALMGLIEGKDVEIESTKTGKYGRWIGTIYTENASGDLFNVNEAMIRLGHARKA